VLDWYFPAGGAIAVDLLFGDSPSELISNIYAQILFSPFSFIFGPVLFGVSINGGVSLSTIRSEYAYGSLTLELMIAIDNHSRIYARGGVGTGASATDFSVPIEVGYLWWF